MNIVRTIARSVISVTQGVGQAGTHPLVTVGPLRKHAAVVPGAPAVVFSASSSGGGTVITRTKLLSMIDSVATLDFPNLPTSAPVVLSARNDLWTIVALLALADVRGHPVTLVNDSAPLREIAECIRAADPSLILLPRGSPHELELPMYLPNPLQAAPVRGLTSGAELVAIRTDASSPSRTQGGQGEEKAPSPLRVRPMFDGAFICQLTSGSCGAAKLVGRARSSVMAEMASVIERTGLCADDRVLVASPLAHSYALVGGLLSTLAVGGTLYVSSAPGEAPAIACSAARPTVIFGVPSTYAALAGPDYEGKVGAMRSHVRLAMSAGSALNRAVYDTLLARTGIRVRQNYGCTELGTIAIDDTSETAELPRSAGPACYGRPLPHHEVHLVFESDAARLSPGEGEICVGGPHVSSAHYFSACGTYMAPIATGTHGYPSRDGARLVPPSDGNSAAESEPETAAEQEPMDVASADEPPTAEGVDWLRVTGDQCLYSVRRMREYVRIKSADDRNECTMVDPEKIERALRTVPGVAEVVVFALPTPAAGRKSSAQSAAASGAVVAMGGGGTVASVEVGRLMEAAVGSGHTVRAVIVPRAGGPVDLEGVARELRTFSKYALESVDVVVRDSLPRSPAGKTLVKWVSVARL